MTLEEAVYRLADEIKKKRESQDKRHRELLKSFERKFEDYIDFLREKK